MIIHCKCMRMVLRSPNRGQANRFPVLVSVRAKIRYDSSVYKEVPRHKNRLELVKDVQMFAAVRRLLTQVVGFGLSIGWSYLYAAIPLPDERS